MCIIVLVFRGVPWRARARMWVRKLCKQEQTLILVFFPRERNREFDLEFTVVVTLSF